MTPDRCEVCQQYPEHCKKGYGLATEAAIVHLPVHVEGFELCEDCFQILKSMNLPTDSKKLNARLSFDELAPQQTVTQ